MNNLQQLHQQEFDQWLDLTVQLLKNHEFEKLDLENLIEKIEDMGREQKNAVESLLEQIIRHFLLLDFWEREKNNNLGLMTAEIVSFRTQLKKKLTTNLKKHLASELDNIYRDGLRFSQAKTEGTVRDKSRTPVNFPEECPYSLLQLLDEDYFP